MVKQKMSEHVIFIGFRFIKKVLVSFADFSALYKNKKYIPVNPSSRIFDQACLEIPDEAGW